MSSLTVYKASAGSGKTFTLAVAYIKLLVANPASYRNILAVTFTNKATEEMKTRILSQLYGISRGLAESDDYLKKIALETQMAEDDIRKAASAALSLLIHNYDYFHVETIDTFFQSVLRNLARELDLSANLRVELNDTAVENQAVDLMIEELDRKSPLFSWIVRFIMENIDKNNSWNIIGSVKDFGRMIFNDQYREIGKAVNEKLSDSRFLTSYRTKLRAEEIAAREILKETSSEFFRLIGKYGIQEEDFKGGQRSGIQKYFHRLAEDDLSDRNFIPKTVANCMESEENWVAKTNKNRDLIIRAARESLMPLLERAEKDDGRDNSELRGRHAQEHQQPQTAQRHRKQGEGDERRGKQIPAQRHATPAANDDKRLRLAIHLREDRNTSQPHHDRRIPGHERSAMEQLQGAARRMSEPCQDNAPGSDRQPHSGRHKAEHLQMESRRMESAQQYLRSIPRILR